MYIAVMPFRFAFLITVLMFGSVNVFAQNPDASSVHLVESSDNRLVKMSSELKILGCGLEDRKTGQKIAVACFNESCNKIRHVLFSADAQSAKFIGPIYTVTLGDEPTVDDYRQTSRQIGKKFKTYRKQKNYWLYGSIILVSAVATGGLAIYVWSTTALTGLAYTLLASNWTLCGVGAAVVNNSDTGNISNVAKAIRDQNGWNWSIEPKKITHFKFRQYSDFLGGN